jgi:hypothetical protein
MRDFKFSRWSTTIRAFWYTALFSVAVLDQSFRDAYCLHHLGNECLMLEAAHASETSVYYIYYAISHKALIFVKCGVISEARIEFLIIILTILGFKELNIIRQH